MRRDEYLELVKMARAASKRCVGTGGRPAPSMGNVAAAASCACPLLTRLHAPKPPCSLADMLEQQGYAGGEQWLAAWEAAWHRNLERCDAAGDCLIHTT